MTRTQYEDAYFEWIYRMVCERRFAKENSFRKLLIFLHDEEFTYSIPKDENRAEDGEELRWWFALEYTEDPDERDFIVDCLSRPCSVLEMILGLAYRCEEIMDNAEVGNRTGQWFWKMINNLGLSGMTDRVFDQEEAEEAVQRFLRREYEPNGRGGLFYVRHCDLDLRDEEIWTQMLEYLNSIT